ncbi:MAG: DUF481 domain-containing protein [Epsilonproteobacteria bacterium]|nr:DUF481 domain-containing protein [Campylobacterota bacterium]
MQKLIDVKNSNQTSGAQLTHTLEAGISFESTLGNTNVISFEPSLRYIFRYGNYATLVIASYDYLESSGTMSQNDGFIHIRELYQYHDDWTMETFLQLQTNPFKSIESRFLAGAGDRYFMSLPYIKVWLGLGGFYVYSVEDKNQSRLFRVNTYAALESKVDNLTATLVSYFQPRFGDFSDFETVNQFQLKYRLNENFSVVGDFEYTHDSMPVSGYKEYDFLQTIGLMFKF